MEAERLTAIFDGDLTGLRSASREADKIITTLEDRIKNLKTSIKIDTKPGDKGGLDKAMRDALATVEKYKRENIKAEKELSSQVEREAKNQANTRIREARRSATELIRSLNLVQKESAVAANSSRSSFSTVFQGSFFGSLAGNLVSFFTAQLSQLPSAIGDILGKARDEALKFDQNLQGLALFSGSMDAAKVKVEELAKVAAATPGLTFLSAIEGQKRLQGIGFEAAQATKTLVGLSKVQLLSGATKEDFDAMLINLVQIASGGQKVTQEIREMAGRMPAIVSIIKKEFGGIGQELNDIDPKEFIKRLSDAMASAPVAVSPANDAIENYNDAWDRLTITVGGYLANNPKMIEANKILAEQINSYTDNVNNADTQTGKFAKDGVSYYAELKAGGLSFIGGMIQGFKMLGLMVAEVGATIGLVVAAVFDTVLAPFQMLIHTIKQGLTSLNNFAYDNLPTGLLQGMGIGINRMPDIAESPEYYKNTRDVANQMAELAAEIKKSYKSFSTFSKEADEAVKRIRNAGKKDLTLDWGVYTEGGKKPNPFGSTTDAVKSTSGGSGLRGKKRKDANTDGRTSADIAEVARALGFTPGKLRRPALNEGSLHPAAKALDISIKGKSEQEIAELIAALLKKGFRVVDERKKIPGVFQTAPHIHSEVNDRKESYLAWDKSLKYGNIPVGMLKELDEQRFTKARGGIDKEDISRYTTKQSDEITKAQRDKKLRELFDVFKKIGMNPGALLDDFTRLLVEDAKNAGTVQPTQSDVTDIFTKAQNEIRDKRGALTTEQPSIGTSLETRTAPGEEFVQSLRESLNLKERYQNLIVSEKNLTAEVSVLLEEKNTQLDESRNTAEKEYQLINRRNLAEEISVGLLRARNAQAQQTGDVERDLAILRAQNNNPEYVSQRRLLSAKSEELSLEQQITQLQDDVINGGINEGMKIQIALLEDVLQLRDLETQKIIEANRSIQYRLQVQLAQLPTYGTQIKDFFGNLPTAFGDMFAQGLQSWDGTFKGFLEGIRQSFSQMLLDLAAQMLRSAVIKLFTNLLGSAFGGLFGVVSEGASGGWATGSAGLPGLAAGGTAYGGMAHLVGERGPEIFVPGKTGTVVNNRDTQKLLGGRGSGGGNINVSINQTIAAPRGLVAPKSARQAADQATSSLSKMLKGQ